MEENLKPKNELIFRHLKQKIYFQMLSLKRLNLNGKQ